MTIQTVSNSSAYRVSRPKLNPVNVTGYGALLTGTACVIAASNKKIKWHKYFAYLAGALGFLHTGIIAGVRLSHIKKDK